MTNSTDPDQLASSEANWSGAILFAKQRISGFSMTRVKEILCQKTTLKTITEILHVTGIWNRRTFAFIAPDKALFQPKNGNIFSTFKKTYTVRTH